MALKPERIDALSLMYYSLLENSGDSGSPVEYFNDTQVRLARSGQVAMGVLMQDVRDVDYTQQVQPTWNNQATSGEVVKVLKKGVIVTDKFEKSAHTIGAGSGAVVGNAGAVHSTYNASHLASALDTVPHSGNLLKGIVHGKFLGASGTDGYVRIYIDPKK